MPLLPHHKLEAEAYLSGDKELGSVNRGPKLKTESHVWILAEALLSSVLLEPPGEPPFPHLQKNSHFHHSILRGLLNNMNNMY